MIRSWKALLALEVCCRVPYLTRELLPFGILWTVIRGIASGVFSVSFSVLSGSTTPETRGRVMSFAYLPVNLVFIFGPLVGSVITRAGLFTVFPAAFVYTLCSLFVLYYAWRQALLAGKAQPIMNFDGHKYRLKHISPGYPLPGADIYFRSYPCESSSYGHVLTVRSLL